MSLWGEYIKEKYNKGIVEDDNGFSTYLIFNKEIYIEDIYIVPEKRDQNYWRILWKQLKPIILANECETISCCIFLKSNNPENSLGWLLKLGFKLTHIIDNNIIYLKCKLEDYYKNEH